MTVSKRDALASRNREQPISVSHHHHSIKHQVQPHPPSHHSQQPQQQQHQQQQQPYRFTISPTPEVSNNDFLQRMGRCSEMMPMMPMYANHSFLVTPQSFSPPPRIISSILKKSNLRYNKAGVDKKKEDTNNKFTSSSSSSSLLSIDFEPPASVSGTASASAFSSCEFPSLSLSPKKSSSVFRLERSPSSSSAMSLSPSKSMIANNGNSINSSNDNNSTQQVHMQTPTTTTHYEVPSLQKGHNISRSASPNSDGINSNGNTNNNSNTIVSPHQFQGQYSVRFYPNVYKKIIPHRLQYSAEERQQMWCSLEEIRVASKRNILEFSYDKWKWRTATEEIDMYYNIKTGRHDIHPAVNLYRIRQQEYLLLQRKEQQRQRHEQHEHALHIQQQQPQPQLQPQQQPLEGEKSTEVEAEAEQQQHQQQHAEKATPISPATTPTASS